MKINRIMIVAASALLPTAAASASVTVDYTTGIGGDNPHGVGGYGASAIFNVEGTTMTVLLSNPDTALPLGPQVEDRLLVSLAFDLGEGVSIVSGDSAVVGPGSMGIGTWAGLSEDDSVAEEWLWSNHGGGDLLADYPQIISTSNRLPGMDLLDFAGNPANVGGPFGGIAASHPLHPIPQSERAVSGSIRFSLTLSETLSEAQLAQIALGSVVEFGSNFQYLAVPSPGAAALFGFALFRRRRRSG